jgi:oxygen-independent coproporphyrinogen-3 oxidase
MKDWFKFAEENPQEFTIQYPPRREYFQEKFKHDLDENLFTHHPELLLYVHIPFCEAKCYYCNFAVDISSNQTVFQNYTNALITELRSKQHLLDEGKVFSGIDIGGGTPTRLPIPLLSRILDELAPFAASSNHPNPLSIETTPSIASEEYEKLQMLSEKGINRVSIGIQSFNDEKLEDVNRSLQKEKNEIAVENVRKAKIDILNIDLIFGLPKQSIEDWEYDLKKVIDLMPESITTYDCLYRGKGRILTKKAVDIPTPNQYGKMYDRAYELLTEAGYSAVYGSVNFTLRKEDLGVSSYFKGRLLEGLPYIGIGNYASSQVDNYWFFNPYHVKDYLVRNDSSNFSKMDCYRLPDDEIQAKYILSSLNFGIIDEVRFKNRFNQEFSSLFKDQLAFAQAKEWISKKDDCWQIKSGRFRDINYLRSLFHSSSAKEWLKNLYDQS